MTSKCFFIGTTLADNPVPHHFVALANELARRDHRIVILAPHRRTDLEDHTGNPAIYTWPSNRPTKIDDMRFLYRLIRQYRPSCLIANFVAVNTMCTVGFLAGIRCRVAWYHTLSDQIQTDSGLPVWKLKLLRWRKRVVYRLATHIVAVSRAALRDLVGVYGIPELKCRVFLNALADPLAGESETGTVARDLWLICVGRLSPSKGQDILLRAVTVLRDRYPGLMVEFVGTGPSRDSLEQLAADLGIADRCVFAGHIAHGQVLASMRRATATVVPSRSEAFGLVTIESLAVGTPVIGSAVGGIPEVLRDGVDGFLVPPGDPQALAEKLGAVLGDATMRREMSRNAREGFLAHLEQERAVREQADWLETIVAHP